MQKKNEIFSYKDYINAKHVQSQSTKEKTPESFVLKKNENLEVVVFVVAFS